MVVLEDVSSLPTLELFFSCNTKKDCAAVSVSIILLTFSTVASDLLVNVSVCLLSLSRVLVFDFRARFLREFAQIKCKLDPDLYFRVTAEEESEHLFCLAFSKKIYGFHLPHHWMALQNACNSSLFVCVCVSVSQCGFE